MCEHGAVFTTGCTNGDLYRQRRGICDKKELQGIVEPYVSDMRQRENNSETYSLSAGKQVVCNNCVVDLLFKTLNEAGLANFAACLRALKLWLSFMTVGAQRSSTARGSTRLDSYDFTIDIYSCLMRCGLRHLPRMGIGSATKR